ANLPDLLRAGDLVVVNNTRVFPARLLGRRVPSGGAVGCLLVSRRSDPVSVSVSDTVFDTVSGTVSHTASVTVPGTVSGTDTVSDTVPGTVPGPVSDTVSVSDTRSDSAAVWEALMHPGQKLKPGSRVVFEGDKTIHGEVLERLFFGRRLIRLWTD